MCIRDSVQDVFSGHGVYATQRARLPDINAAGCTRFEPLTVDHYLCGMQFHASQLKKTIAIHFLHMAQRLHSNYYAEERLSYCTIDSRQVVVAASVVSN